MYSKLDDILALCGFGCVLAGVYIWLGLPAALILLGIVLVYMGIRLDLRREQHEPD